MTEARYSIPEALFQIPLLDDPISWKAIDNLMTNKSSLLSMLPSDICESLKNDYLPVGEREGIHNMINWSIMSSPSSLLREMCHNIVLAGGTSELPGIEQRIKRELEGITPCPARVITTLNSWESTWRGASIVGGLPAYHSIFVTREEYEEVGWTKRDFPKDTFAESAKEGFF